MWMPLALVSMPSLIAPLSKFTLASISPFLKLLFLSASATSCWTFALSSGGASSRRLRDLFGFGRRRIERRRTPPAPRDGMSVSRARFPAPALCPSRGRSRSPVRGSSACSARRLRNSAGEVRGARRPCLSRTCPSCIASAVPARTAWGLRWVTGSEFLHADRPLARRHPRLSELALDRRLLVLLLRRLLLRGAAVGREAGAADAAAWGQSTADRDRHRRRTPSDAPHQARPRTRDFPSRARILTDRRSAVQLDLVNCWTC